MNHLALFNGIGGFQLPASWVGWNNIAHVEINKKLNGIIKRHFPNSKAYEDIKEFDGIPYRGTIDIISGGDPCQPHSIAGLRKGKEDNRYLWPEMFRIIKEVRPAWIVNENVTGSVSNGILDSKIDDLESEGYTCRPFIIPAEAVGALHKRNRVWLIAYNPDKITNRRKSNKFQKKSKKNGYKNGTTYNSLRSQLIYGITIPTPTLNDHRNSTIPPSQEYCRKGYQGSLVSALIHTGISPGTKLNPHLYEALMGYPKDWTIPDET